MENNIIEDFIQECGSVTRAAKVLSLKREHLSSMRRGLIEVSLLYALKIEKYMREKTGKRINHLDLVSPWMRHQLKNLNLPCAEQPIELIKVSLSSVQYRITRSQLNRYKQSKLDLNQMRPILIDQSGQLIANVSTYIAYLQQDKKTVPAWRILFSHLLEKRYSLTELIQNFLMSERAAIGIAVKKYLGNRQGERTDLKLGQNSARVKGRTDVILASLLGFGCKESYRQIEKIQLLGSQKLIQYVDEKKLAPSTAAKLTHFNTRKQEAILTRDRKEILNFIYRSKNKEINS